MKKDKKFLNDLENCLNSIGKKKRDAIVLKYQEIINQELENKRRIKEIIKELGTPEEVAQKEINNIKSNKRNILSFLKREKKDKKKKKTLKDLFIKKNKKRKKKSSVNIKERFKAIWIKITKDISFKKKEKIKPTEVVEDIVEDVQEEISEVTQIVTEKHLFESKKTRTRRIILKTLGIVLIGILLFIWLWITVVFIASLVAFLDGIRIIGINIALFGLELLLFWIVIMVNRAVFKKKNNIKLNIIIIIIAVLLIGIGIAFTITKLSKIESVEDVSEKYSMTTKFDTYFMPSDENIKMYILFNSNYDTQYMINYDNTLDNKIKIEVKYYECYYDYYAKKSSNNIYVSLKLDKRDRLSVYLNDFKDGKIYDNEELSRYVVKISVNKKDYERLVIEN